MIPGQLPPFNGYTARLAEGMKPAAEPPWMDTARRLLGAKEIPGKLTAPFISGMLHKLGAWWDDDETPWCATFVSWCLAENGFEHPKAFYRARAFASWGRTFTVTMLPSAWPAYGAICVLNRGLNAQQGHAGFYVGTTIETVGREDQHKVLILGGNQENQVCVRAFHPARVEAYRWPLGYPVAGYELPHSAYEFLVDNIPQARSEA